jgi:hypothetical protein
VKPGIECARDPIESLLKDTTVDEYADIDQVLVSCRVLRAEHDAREARLESFEIVNAKRAHLGRTRAGSARSELALRRK